MNHCAPISRIHWCATQAFPEGEVSGFYQHWLICKTILDELTSRKFYREGVRTATFTWFDASEIQLTEQISCTDVDSHTVCLVPDRFACFQILNDSRSSSEEKDLARKIRREKWSGIIKFDNLFTARLDYAAYNAIFMRAIFNIMQKNFLFITMKNMSLDT